MGDLRALHENLRIYQAELEQQNEELRATQAAAERALTRYTALFSEIPLPALVLNGAGRILEANQAAIRVLELRNPRLRRQILPRLIDPACESALRHALEQALDGAGRQIAETRIPRPDGTALTGELHLAPLPAETADEARQLICTFVDLTCHHQAERVLDLQRRRAEAAVAARSEFLATMSHEIRTPMNGVIGMTGILMDTPLSDEQRQYVETIRASGEALVGLINDILDFSRIDAGRLELEAIDFAPRALLEELRALHEPRAREKGLRLWLDCPPEIPYVLTGDPGRLRQILTNLVGNAIKFTARGEVGIQAALDGKMPGAIQLRFQVRDTGIGIPRACQAGLFHRFVQSDPGTARQFGGSGLGLAICRQLVSLMDGEIGVESEEGQGSEFWFTVRFDTALDMPAAACVPASCPVRQPAAPPARTANLTGRRILLVEDNLINQKVALTILDRLGLGAEVAADGAEALRMLATNRYDLVLMDVQMPVMDGLEATRRIRAPDSPVLDPGVPIVAMTANAMKGDRERYLEAGMNDYMTKPFVPETLASMLATWLTGAPAPEPLLCDPDEIPPLDQLPVFDRAALLQRLGGDVSSLEELVAGFLVDLDHHLRQLGEWLDQGNRAAAARLAHTIKGTAANLGAMRLSAAAETLDRLIAASGPEAAARAGLADLERAAAGLRDELEC